MNEIGSLKVKLLLPRVASKQASKYKIAIDLYLVYLERVWLQE